MKTLNRSAVIIAGGKGSRLVNEGVSTPKILIRIQELTVLERMIRVLSSAGVSNFYFILGYQSEIIIEEIKRLQNVYDFCYHTFIETQPMGTAGHLMEILDELPSTFMLAFGDLFLDLDLDHYFHYFERLSNLSGLVISRSSEHPEDSNLIEVDESGFITEFSFKGQHLEEERRIRAITGIFFFSKEFLGLRKIELDRSRVLDLEQDVLNLPKDSQYLIKAIPLKGLVRDIGTLGRLEGLKNELIHYLSTNYPFQKYALLDRDGVLIKDIGHRNNTKDLEIPQDTINGLRILHNFGYRFVVVTNQPVIARGQATFRDIEQIHGLIDRILLKEGIFIDEYYVCPHHPESGYEGENTKYKVRCDCRKPALGLIDRAFLEIGMSQSNTIFIGDSWRDAEAAKGYKIPYYMASHYNQEGDVYSTFEDLAKRIVSLKREFDDYL